MREFRKTGIRWRSRSTQAEADWYPEPMRVELLHATRSLTSCRKACSMQGDLHRPLLMATDLSTSQAINIFSDHSQGLPRRAIAPVILSHCQQSVVFCAPTTPSWRAGCIYC